MKALELTIHPRICEEPNPVRDGWDVWTAWEVQRTKEVRGQQAKHLTDAELAAESWRQMSRAVIESGAVDLGDNQIAPGDAFTYGPVRVECARIATVTRFAITPHYFEEEA